MRTTPTSSPLSPAQVQLAEQLARLEADPRDAEAWRLAADAMLALGQLADGIHALRQAAAIRPEADLCTRIGLLLARQGVRDEPEQWFRRAIQIDPHHRTALVQLGFTRLDLADTETAADCFVRVLEREPFDADAGAGVALVLDRRGDTDDAWRVLQQVISRHRGHVRVALAAATIGPHVGQLDAALLQVRAALKRASEHDQIGLYFSAGDLHDRLGQHDKAWAAWAAGNALRALPFDPAAHERTIEAMLAATAELPTAEGVDDDRPVLIVGMPRSGTTLVERMLDAHPEVCGVGELEALRDIAVAVASSAKVPTWLHTVPTLGRVAPAIGKTYLSALERHVEGEPTRIVDKMPNNALHLGLVKVALPKARVIWCLRDDDDVALSCFSKPMQAGLPWAGTVEGIRAWQAGLERLRQHWQAHLGERMITVRYEDVVHDTEREARRLIEHLGLDWDPAVLSPHERAASVQTHSWDQVRQPIHGRRMGRAAAYAAFLHPSG